MINAKSIRIFSGLTVALVVLAMITSVFATNVFADDEIIVIMDGSEKYEVVLKNDSTVRDTLERAGIQIGEDDRVTPGLDEKLSSPSTITISRVSYIDVTVEETVPFETVEKIDYNKKNDYSKVTVQGEDGLASVTYRIKTVGGIEESRQEIACDTIKAPRSEEVTVGGIDLSKARMVTVTATAYDGSYQTLGYYNPRTCTGAVPKPYYTVAVDPRLIPLGSKLYIESPDGSYVFGYAKAEDTGGAIKGNRVDLFVSSRSEALGFGKRTMNIYIL